MNDDLVRDAGLEPCTGRQAEKSKSSIGATSVDAAFWELYQLGGVAAWIAAVLILGEVVIFSFYPQPATVNGWFMLFQRSRLVGLLDSWVLEVLLYVMLVLVFLSLYVALRETNPARMAIALTFALLGSGSFLATNHPFAMLVLSNQYAAATTDAQRTAMLAAGQALLAGTNQRTVGGFNLGFFLVSVAGLLVASVMLQSHAFGKSTAYVGLLAHALSLADYLRQALTQSALVTLLVILPSVLFLVVWYGLVGRRLYQLRRLAGKTPPRPPQSEVFK